LNDRAKEKDVSEAETVDKLNAGRPRFLEMLGGQVKAVDAEQRSCTMAFNIGTEFCHSVDVVQGGFVTSMLDATMSHTCFALLGDIVNVATLEIKVSFLEPSRAGKFTATGKLLKAGKSTGFLSAELYNEAGQLTATATTTAKLIRAR
jgi:uncharacterized protein (TIGR00369 family)